ncbi:Tim44 domain-containing protein [Clostridium hydrogenum]|uniref:Tim44 domain-containing protein n=1 Tax=Clostridium hydrogenum TaxID=2855764 RepID=UPI001F263B7B|nr:Tim44-like domain-containing protein [Clostridium hydrogenum]
MLKHSAFIKKLSIVLLILFVLNGHIVVLARAGGGHGGSSGGGASGGGSAHASYNGGGYGGRSNPFFDILNIGVFALVAVGGTIILKVRLEKKRAQSILTIKDLAKSDSNWNYKDMKRNIKEAFYKIQYAWMERNQDLAKEYMSKKLYDEHKMKTEWMEVKKEKNILKNVRLLKWYPIGLEDLEGTDNDNLWIYIKAKAVDYTIDEETNKVIEGKKYIRVAFEEYWKFIRSGNKWVLDEIKQIDDINDLDFFGIDVEHNKKM